MSEKQSQLLLLVKASDDRHRVEEELGRFLFQIQKLDDFCGLEWVANYVNPQSSEHIKANLINSLTWNGGPFSTIITGFSLCVRFAAVLLFWVNQIFVDRVCIIDIEMLCHCHVSITNLFSYKPRNCRLLALGWIHHLGRDETNAGYIWTLSLQTRG